jgi:hypothetical protein
MATRIMAGIRDSEKKIIVSYSIPVIAASG